MRLAGISALCFLIQVCQSKTNYKRNIVMHIQRSQLEEMDRTLSNFLQCMEGCDFNSTCMVFRFFALSQRCIYLDAYPEDIRKKWEIRGSKQATFACPVSEPTPSLGFSPEPANKSNRFVETIDIANNRTISSANQTVPNNKTSSSTTKSSNTSSTSKPSTTHSTTQKPTTTKTTTKATTTTTKTPTKLTTTTPKPATKSTTTTPKPTTKTTTLPTTTTIKKTQLAGSDDLIPLYSYYCFYCSRHRFCTNDACATQYNYLTYTYEVDKVTVGRVISSSKLSHVQSNCDAWSKLKPLSFKVDSSLVTARHVHQFSQFDDFAGYVATEAGVCGATKQILLYKSAGGDYFYSGNGSPNTQYPTGEYIGVYVWW